MDYGHDYGDNTDYYHGHEGDYHGGEMGMDEYGGYKIQAVARDFLIDLAKAIDDGNMHKLEQLYEDSYVKLSGRFFKNSPWPDFTEIEHLIPEDEDKKFLILYKELYYRHLYARGGPHLDDRLASYYNYCDMFNLILSPESPVQLDLPNQWLWEIIDEFIYQFQNFSRYQSMFAMLAEEELVTLKENMKVWNVHSVLNVLHSLVAKSNINRQLEVYTNGGDADSVAGDFGRHPLYRMLGYFSLIELLRLHSLLADYYQAIKVLENIKMNKNSSYSCVPACQITTYYYVGFCYMMMRRYSDAIRTFSNILLYIHRNVLTVDKFQQRTYQVDQINKQTDQMYELLAMCLALHPQRIDESVLMQLKEKKGDKFIRMQQGVLSEFEDSFTHACPKFISPVPPSFEKPPPPEKPEAPKPGEPEEPAPPPPPPKPLHQEPLLAQLKVFMDEIQQQFQIPIIRSYLKLYTTMPIAKLATFLAVEEEDLTGFLLCFKHKMKNLVWTKGTSSLEGEFQSGSEVDFFIDKGMIHIADTKVARRYGDFFIRQIHKFDELHRKVASLQL